MTASINAREFIKGEESFSPTSFWDYKQYTWGWGTKAPGPNAVISKADADKELDNYLSYLSSEINKYVTSRGVKLSQNQFDALTSLVFNLGAGAIFTNKYNNGFPHGSTLYNKILAGDFAAAGNRFGDFVKAGGEVLPGLVKRRAKEAALWFTNQAIVPSAKKTTAFVGLGLLATLIYIAAAHSKKKSK